MQKWQLVNFNGTCSLPINPELEEPSALLSVLDATLPSVHMGDTLHVEFEPTMERLT